MGMKLILRIRVIVTLQFKNWIPNKSQARRLKKIEGVGFDTSPDDLSCNQIVGANNASFGWFGVVAQQCSTDEAFFDQNQNLYNTNKNKLVSPLGCQFSYNEQILNSLRQQFVELQNNKLIATFFQLRLTSFRVP